MMKQLIARLGENMPRRLRSWAGGLPAVKRLNLYLENRPQRLHGALAGYCMRGQQIEIYTSGDYEQEACALLEQYVRPGMVCIDCGAHLGYFTLLLSKLAGETGRVFAFEAHPGNADVVRANTRINKLEKSVVVENKVISDGSFNHAVLYSGRVSSSAEWNIIGHDVEGRQAAPAMVVPSVSLDAYFPQGSHIDFIKMDIEGAEGQALRGMRRILQESQPSIFIEFHDEQGWDGRRELLAAGYSLYDVKKGVWAIITPDMPRIYHCLAVPNERR